MERRNLTPQEMSLLEKVINKENKKKRNKTVKDNRSLVARNIICLRELYGEDRDDLAEAIGLSTSAISNYENDIRPPQRDELFLIAQHYNVSVDDIFNYDFSHEVIEIDAPLNDASNRQLMYSTLLPIMESNESNVKNNIDFRDALALHIEIYNKICEGDDGMDFAMANIDKCTRLYEKAADKGIEAANANLLWWPMLCSITLAFFNKKPESIQELKSKDATIGDMLKAAYLKDYKDLDDDFTDDMEHFIRSEYLGPIFSNIAVLKNSDDIVLRELADYYIAIAYKFNILGAGRIPKPQGRLMGEEMLGMLSLIGNDFAKAYVSAFKKRK